MRAIQTFVLLFVCLSLGSCVVSPPSRSAASSGAPVIISGYVLGEGDKITIQAVNQNTGTLDTLGQTTSTGPGIKHTTSDGTTYTVYPWSYSAGVLDAQYWSPQSIVPDLQTAQGHLELFASDGGSPFATFSSGAAKAVAMAGGQLGISSLGYSDGDSTVLLDPWGVGSNPEGSWVNVAGMTMTPPGYPSVTWSVGYYTVENGKKIYALICAPTSSSGGPYPVVIYNHGGTGSANGGNVNGNVTAAGLTSQPAAPDELGQCVDWAKRGWVFGTSSYRGANVNITSAYPSFAGGTWQSDGNVEFCLGEVTDVLALTDLIMNHASSIALGAPGSTHSPSVSSKLFMYGYSHGGCITWRAVEQGAPVTAVSVIEGFTDLRLSYLTTLQYWPPPPPPPPPPLPTPQVGAAIEAGAYQPGVSTYQPDAAGVMGYNWRSAHYFASRGDLSIQKFQAMPILILHGDDDSSGYNPTPLRQPALIAADLATTNLFVGPTGTPAPTSTPCISGPVGAPLSASLTAPDATCPISFTLKDTGDPCMYGAVPLSTACASITLPLTPPQGEPTQQHYLIVYHSMNHTNGGLAIRNTFDNFVKQNFGRMPGCDGLVWGVCASD